MPRSGPVTLAFIAIPQLLLVAVILSIPTTLAIAAPKPADGDSPGEVVGGSVYLQWLAGYEAENPCPKAPGKICGHSDDTTKLDFDNLGGKLRIVATKGWRIHISDTDPGHGEHDDAVLVCSAPDCSLSPGDGKTFYIQLPPREIVDSNPATTSQFRFHDKQYCGGAHEDRRCDRAVHFKFEIGGEAKPDTRTCNDDQTKPCKVFIGTRKS